MLLYIAVGDITLMCSELPGCGQLLYNCYLKLLVTGSLKLILNFKMYWGYK